MKMPYFQYYESCQITLRSTISSSARWNESWHTLLNWAFYFIIHLMSICTNSSSVWWNKPHHTLLNGAFNSILHLMNICTISSSVWWNKPHHTLLNVAFYFILHLMNITYMHHSSSIWWNKLNVPFYTIVHLINMCNVTFTVSYSRKFKRRNWPWWPSCHHIRRVNYCTSRFFVGEPAKQFRSACIAFLVWT